MISRADIFIDPEPHPAHSIASLHCLTPRRLLTPLTIEHTFRRGDDDFRTRLFARQCLPEHALHAGDIVGIADLTNPLGPDTPDGVRNRTVGMSPGVDGTRGENVLPPRRRGVIVVD